MGKALNGMMPNGYNVYISSNKVKKVPKYKEEKRMKKFFKIIKKEVLKNAVFIRRR